MTDAGKSVARPGLTSRVVGSSIWALGGQVVVLFASLLATPFVIRGLGAAGYGVLALVNLLIGYVSFADVGMGLASTKFASEAHGRKDDRGEIDAIGTALIISMFPSVAAALVLALGGKLLVGWFKVPDDLAPAAVLALQVAALGFLARNAGAVLNTPQLVRLRLDLQTLISTGTSLVQILGVPLALAAGGHLLAAVVVTAGAAGLSLILNAVISWRLAPQLRRLTASRALVRPMLNFGGGMLTANLIGIALTNLEKLLVARYFSVTALAYYTVANTLATMVATAPRAMSSSLLPAFSQLTQLEDRGPLARLYVRAQRGTLLWTTPAAFMTATFAGPFLTIWAGPDYGRESTPILFVLLIGIAAQLLGHVPKELLKAVGRTDLIARCYAYELIPHVIVTIALTLTLGPIGAALAWSARIVGDVALFFWTAARVSGLRFGPLQGKWPAYVIAVACLALPTGLGAAGFATTIVRGMLLVGLSLAALCGYAVVVWSRVLTPDERGFVRDGLARRWRQLRGQR